MAKGSKKKKNPNEAAFFLRYKNEGRYAKNRAAALERHVDKTPTDLQAAERLDASGVFEYRRNAHGKSVLTKDAKDKYRLQAYIHNKSYPPQKKVTQNQGYQGVGKTMREQLNGYVRIS